MDLTLRLPDEILSRLVQPSIIQPSSVIASTHMSVCRRWRAVAMEHPDYWSRFDLRDTSKPTILQHYANRLDHAGSRLCRVRLVATSRNGSNTTFRNTILPLVRHHLGHISVLQVSILDINLEALFTALNAPAPQLERFDIFVELNPFHSPSESREVFPSISKDLFGYSAPRLTTLHLGNICQLYEHPVAQPSPPWFAQIQKLHVSFDGQEDTKLPIVWHKLMPNVQILHPGTFDKLHQMYQNELPASLQRLDYTFQLPGDFPLNIFPEITLSGAMQASTTVSRLLEVFDFDDCGPLELRLAADGERRFTTTISSSGQAKRTRTIRSARSDWEGVDPYKATDASHNASDWLHTSEPNNLFTHQKIFNRVETIEAPLYLLTILEQHLPPRMLRLVQVVVLIVADVGEDVFTDCKRMRKPERLPISCPDLAVVRVRDVYEYRRPRAVDRTRLLDILGRLFDPLPTLTAVNVDLSNSK